MGATLSGCVRTRSNGHLEQARAVGARPGTCAVPDQMAAACGSVGNLFFEPEGATTSENWQFVGEGKGGYSKIQNYSFVGPGQGTFDQEVTKTGYGGCMKKFCTGMCLLLVLAAVGYAALQMESEEGPRLKSEGAKILPDVVEINWGPQTAAPISTAAPAAVPVAAAIAAATTGVPESIVGSSARRYMCATGAQEARTNAAIYAEWDAADTDKSGSVSREEIMVQKQTLSPKTSDLLLDADADGSGSLSFEEFAAALSHSGDKSLRGAKADAAAAHGGDAPSNLKSWSLDKRSWCCGHWGVGCDGLDELAKEAVQQANTTHHKAQSNHTAHAFDCKAGASKWKTGWSGEKKKYCCEQAQVGCETQEPTVHADPYDCEADKAAFQTKWTLGKKDWCCRNKELGCTSEAAPAASTTAKAKVQEPIQAPREEKTTMAPMPHQQHQQQQAEGEPCATQCELKNVTATCKERILWMVSNTTLKSAQNRCTKAIEAVMLDCPACTSCSVAEVGCTNPAPSQLAAPMLFTCDTDDAKGQAGWSAEKRDWCCSNEAKGCPAETTAAPAAGDYAAPSTSRQAPPPPPPPMRPESEQTEFDCRNGIESWQQSWSPTKKNWCCAHKGAGCPPGGLNQDAKFNCAEGFSSWQWGWSDDKKKYCCAVEGKGCPEVVTAPSAPQ